MAFKEINDLTTDVTIALGGVDRKTNKKNPTVIQGYYLGFKTIPDNKKKSGKSYIYVFQTPDGNVGVWGKTDLDRKMAAVEPGFLVRVTQSGMAPTKNGDMYKYKVEVDTENSIDVSNVAGASSVAAATGATDIDEGDGDDDTDDLPPPADEIPYTPPVAPKTAAKAPSESSQASIQALLNKSRNKSA